MQGYPTYVIIEPLFSRVSRSEIISAFATGSMEYVFSNILQSTGKLSHSNAAAHIIYRYCGSLSDYIYLVIHSFSRQARIK